MYLKIVEEIGNKEYDSLFMVFIFFVANKKMNVKLSLMEYLQWQVYFLFPFLPFYHMVCIHVQLCNGELTIFRVSILVGGKCDDIAELILLSSLSS